jgi:hypothetical protein
MKDGEMAEAFCKDDKNVWRTENVDVKWSGAYIWVKV